MKLGNSKNFIFILIFFFTSTFSIFAEDKIKSVPLINLEELSPTFEEDKDELEKIEKINVNLNNTEDTLEKSNIKSTFINGLRVTNKETMEIVQQSLEDFNNEIVAAFTKKSCEASGINVSKNNVFIVEQESKELGFVGKPKKILSEKILSILEKNLVPVLSPMGLDNDGQRYNINADTAACAIAKSLKSRRLLLMTDVEGVYDLEKRLISEIKPFDLKNLTEWKIVQGGMIPKIKNCIDAVENGVRGVVIIDGRKPHSILHEIFSDKGSGTLIRK